MFSSVILPSIVTFLINVNEYSLVVPSSAVTVIVLTVVNLVSTVAVATLIVGSASSIDTYAVSLCVVTLISAVFTFLTMYSNVLKSTTSLFTNISLIATSFDTLVNVIL